MFSSLFKYKDFALLIMRIGLGSMFLYHGYPKIMGGMEMWGKLGGAMSHIGVNFYPILWGFLASVAEFGGGLFLLFGFGTRIASFFLFTTMLIASISHMANGDSLGDASHALELTFIFFAMIILGPGKYSVDKK